MGSSAALATRFLGLLFFTVLVALLAGCQPNRPSGLGSTPTPVRVQPAAKLVWNGRYADNIQPIFNLRCVSCHGPNRAENGLRLDSYAGVMKGTQYGPVVTRGSPSGSTLVAVLTGSTDPSLRMPHGEQRTSEQELQNITLWIEAGAPPD